MRRRKTVAVMLAVVFVVLATVGVGVVSNLEACTYCSEVCCGCDPPPLGQYVRCSCACAPPNCWQTCKYINLPN